MIKLPNLRSLFELLTATPHKRREIGEDEDTMASGLDQPIQPVTPVVYFGDTMGVLALFPLEPFFAHRDPSPTFCLGAYLEDGVIEWDAYSPEQILQTCEPSVYEEFTELEDALEDDGSLNLYLGTADEVDWKSCYDHRFSRILDYKSLGRPEHGD